MMIHIQDLTFGCGKINLYQEAGKQWDFNSNNKGQYGVFFDVDLVAEYPGSQRV
jgi:hypothetical protein